MFLNRFPLLDTSSMDSNNRLKTSLSHRGSCIRAIWNLFTVANASKMASTSCNGKKTGINPYGNYSSTKFQAFRTLIGKSLPIVSITSIPMQVYIPYSISNSNAAKLQVCAKHSLTIQAPTFSTMTWMNKRFPNLREVRWLNHFGTWH